MTDVFDQYSLSHNVTSANISLYKLKGQESGCASYSYNF